MDEYGFRRTCKNVFWMKSGSFLFINIETKFVVKINSTFLSVLIWTPKKYVVYVTINIIRFIKILKSDTFFLEIWSAGRHELSLKLRARACVIVYFFE